MKITAARDHPAGRVRQPHLGAAADRRGPGRPGRDLHGRRRGRGLPARDASRRSCSARDPLQIEARQRDARSTISAGAAPASRRAATRRSTSRCGTCSARRSAGRSARCSAARARDSHPRLQHLRRLQVHPRRARAGGRQLACRRAAAVPTRTSRPSCTAPTNLPHVAARAGHHRHEDLAVRHRRRAHRRLGHHAGRARHRARAVPQDPQGRRRPDGHHGRVPLAVEPADGEASSPSGSPSSTPTGTRIRSGSTTSPT